MFEEKKPSGIVYGLSANLAMAAHMAKSAKVHHLAVHNFDRSEALLKAMAKEKPVLIVLDWDTCEAEAFKVLKEMRQNAEFKSIAAVGCISSGTKNPVREEAQRAGCHRVYTRTEFLREIDFVLARYGKP